MRLGKIDFARRIAQEATAAAESVAESAELVPAALGIAQEATAAE